MGSISGSFDSAGFFELPEEKSSAVQNPSPKKTKPVIVIHYMPPDDHSVPFDPQHPHHRRSPFRIYPELSSSFKPISDSCSLRPETTDISGAKTPDASPLFSEPASATSSQEIFLV